MEYLVTRAGAALEGVVLGDAIEPVESAAACGSVDSHGGGMLILAAPARVAAEVGRMVRGGAERRDQRD
jgi:hypothetical protein